jgi:hypothetical protein
MESVIYQDILNSPGMGGLFAALVTAAVAIFNYPNIDPNLRPVNIPSSDIAPSYDFIVVGSGSAGMTITNSCQSIVTPDDGIICPNIY